MGPSLVIPPLLSQNSGFDLRAIKLTIGAAERRIPNKVPHPKPDQGASVPPSTLYSISTALLSLLIRQAETVTGIKLVQSLWRWG